MKTKIKREPLVFILKLNRLELIHLEAAVDAFRWGVEDTEHHLLGRFGDEYDSEVVSDIHAELDVLRGVIIDEELS